MEGLRLGGIGQLWTQLGVVRVVAGVLGAVATFLGIYEVLGLPWAITVVSLAIAGAVTALAATHTGNGEAAELRRQLEVATRNANHEVIEEHIMTLEVADPRGGPDRELFEYSTRAMGTEPCLWRRISYSSPDSAPTRKGFQVRVARGKGTLIGLAADSTTWTGVFFFETPIKPGEAPRDWALAVEWPGLADPLRKRGKDILLFRSQIRHDLLTIRVTIPASWRSLPDAFEHVVPTVGRQTREDNGTRVILEWQIESPDRGVEYAAYFKASVT